MITAGVPLPGRDADDDRVDEQRRLRERLEEARVMMVGGGGFSQPLDRDRAVPRRGPADVQGR